MSAPEKLQTQLIQFGSVREAKVSPDGNFLLSLGEDDGILAVSDASNLSQSDEYNFASLTGDRIRSFVSLPGKGVVIFCDEAHDIFRVDWRAPIDESSASKLVKPDLDPSIICVDSDGKRLAVTGSDDPQIIVWNLENLEEEPVSIFDNVAMVKWMEFGPRCKTLVTVNDGDVLMAFRDFQQVAEVENVKCEKFGVTWTNDTELIVANSEASGTIRVFDFSREMAPETVKIPAHSAEIVAVAVSSQNMLASVDSKQIVVLSKVEFSGEGKKVAPVCVFPAAMQDAVTNVLWLGNRLCAGASNGEFALWKQVDGSEMKELTVMASAMEEEERELSDWSDGDSQPLPRTIVMKNKHEMAISAGEYSSGYEEEEEEEEIVEKLGRRRFELDEAVEVAGYSSEDEMTEPRKPAPRQEPRSRQSKEMFKKLEEKYGDESSSGSEYTSESDSDENGEMTAEKVKQRREEEKRIHKEMKEFVADSDQSPEQSEGEEEDHIDQLTESDEYESEGEHPDDQCFMPGSTQDFFNKRRFMCWNLIGAIFQRENQDESTSIDVEFADTTRYRDVHMDNKTYSFILGSISTGGTVLASRNVFQFKLHKTWAPDNEFMCRFKDDERIDLVACGETWVAVATDIQRLRLYLSSGLEVAALSIPARVTTMVGSGNYLGLLYARDSVTCFMFLDVIARRTLAEGTVPVRRPIRWIGIDMGNLYVMGNDCVLCQLVFNFGTQWVPVCDVRAHMPEEATDFFCVGVSDGSLWGVFLDEGQVSPQTVSHQDIQSLPIEPLAVDQDYRGYLSAKYSYLTAKDKEHKEQMATDVDKALLRKFGEAIKDGRLELASQIGKRIVTAKAKTLVVQFAHRQDASDLAEFLESYYQETAEEEENNEPEEPEAGASEDVPESESHHEEDAHEAVHQEEEASQSSEEAAETETQDDEDSIGE